MFLVKYTKEKQDEIFHYYLDNEMSNLKKLCKKIFTGYEIPMSEEDDLYSIGMEVLMNSVANYDSDLSNAKFTSYLIGNIKRKFQTYIRDNKYTKKRAKIETYKDDDGNIQVKSVKNLSIDETINSDNDITLGQTLSSDFDIWNEIFEDKDTDKYSEKMQNYLKRLSKRQKKILFLLADGFDSDYICKELNIKPSEYYDNVLGIRCERNKKLLYGML